jgi:hypothetical protein
MHDYTLAHLSDTVLRDLAALVARDRLTTATLLTHMAEVDARRLYLPAGYPSMHGYCEMLARRFGPGEARAMVRALAIPAGPMGQLAPGQVGSEPPRDSRRLHSLRGWGLWRETSFLRSCGSVRCGWS